MRPDRLRVLAWWSSRVVLPIVLLATASALVGRSSFDRASLEPFFDEASGEFPLRHDWFFDGVLHLGGRSFVGLAAIVSIGFALAGWRNPRWRLHSARFAYLALSFLVTIVVAGSWKDVADQVTPWNTVGFGGNKPWPGNVPDASWMDVVGSPGAHASSGFAWVSLYFVGLTLGTRFRWLWLAPGLLLGCLFGLGQHVRGAHQPSHEFLSVAIAWGVAAALAALFRRLGWLDWSEVPVREERPVDRELVADPTLPWLAGTAMALVGACFYAVDGLSEKLEPRHPWLYLGLEVVELGGMALGVGVTAWLLVDRIAAWRVREARRAELERGHRLQLLGRMAASVAHEVRNPLHTLRLILEEQRIDIPALGNHALRRELDTCVARIDRAVELVYRLARPEAGEVEHSNLTDAAREAVRSLQRVSDGRVSFDWSRSPPDASIGISRMSIGIVLDNLLRNASEASPDGGVVSLELTRAGDCWQLRIENAGSLDEPRKAGERGGLGLGLPISRQIIAGAGGSLEIEEADGTVRCTLKIPEKQGSSL